jgi:hypothetical protein
MHHSEASRASWQRWQLIWTILCLAFGRSAWKNKDRELGFMGHHKYPKMGRGSGILWDQRGSQGVLSTGFGTWRPRLKGSNKLCDWISPLNSLGFRILLCKVREMDLQKILSNCLSWGRDNIPCSYLIFNWIVNAGLLHAQKGDFSGSILFHRKVQLSPLFGLRLNTEDSQIHISIWISPPCCKAMFSTTYSASLLRYPTGT